VKNWFQNLPFKCDLQRYMAVLAKARMASMLIKSPA
jgi:hypothetical protein